ncbi:MAG: DUF2937 family protein [Acetobacteraceae bacterium]|nr:DUF2937 family protein [Acetobacteraceae bacterium]
MAGFIARWLSDALRIGLPLVLGLAAMQVPALAHGYTAALLQIAEDARRDIEQRKAAARRFYRDAGDADEAVIGALRAVEPSNAQALAASVERARAFRAAHDRIEAAPPLLRPVAALLDMAEDPAKGDKWAVLRTALDTHAPQVVLSAAAAVYGSAGLLLGSFLAELLVSAAGAASASARRGRGGARLAR